MEVTLNNGEVAIATVIGTMRATTARAAGVANKKVGPQTDVKTDVTGFAAELAFCKSQNIHADFTIGPQALGADCVMPDPRWIKERAVAFHRTLCSVDVKATSYDTGRLIVPPHKKKSGTDLYVLVTGRMPVFKIVGYADAEEVFKETNYRLFNGQHSYILEQSQLHSFDEHI
jgi:hypothetical protein